MRLDCTGRSVTRTEATISCYRERYDNLCLMAEREAGAGGDIEKVIAWFRRQDCRWAASTIRQYRAALRCALELTRLHPSVRKRLERLVTKGPAPRVSGPKRTSARKRKSLPLEEFSQLIQYLRRTRRPNDALIASFLGFGIVLFLRPSEYLQACIKGNVLHVKNAKATNGRGNGKSRARDLAPLGEALIGKLDRFLQNLRKAAKSSGCWRVLHGRLAARLAWVCRILNIKRVSLYTLRHVGMATAKLHLEPREVAAAAGHASVATATSHYAKRRTGWRRFQVVCRPTQDSVERVRGRVKYFRPSGPVRGAAPA